MQAVIKSTSNGELSKRQSRAEPRREMRVGVETCAESHRVVAGIKHSTVVGEAPTMLNGGHEPRAHQRSIDSRRYSPNLRANGEPVAADARRPVRPTPETTVHLT